MRVSTDNSLSSSSLTKVEASSRLKEPDNTRAGMKALRKELSSVDERIRALPRSWTHAAHDDFPPVSLHTAFKTVVGSNCIIDTNGRDRVRERTHEISVSCSPAIESKPSLQATRESSISQQATRLLDKGERCEQRRNLLRGRKRLEAYGRPEKPVSNSPFADACNYRRLGVVNWKIGEYETSAKVLRKSLTLMRGVKIGAPLHEIEGLITVLSTLGRVHVSLGELDPAYEYACKALDVVRNTISNREDTLERLQPCLARSLICFGMVNDARSHRRQAMNIYKKYLQIQCTCLGNNDVDIAATINCIGGIHEKQCACEEAMVCYSEALRIYRSQVGLQCCPVDLAVTLNNVGYIHHLWRQHGRALDMYREALEIFRLWVGTGHKNFASTQFNIARTLIEQGLSLHGLDILAEVLRSQLSIYGEDHPDVAITFESIALAHEYLGQFSKACWYHEKALGVRVRGLGSKHLLVSRSFDQLGMAHNECGRIDLAVHCLREALVICRQNCLHESDERIRSIVKRLANLDKTSRTREARHSFLRHS